ncbi:TM0106 family RecB-like putative nuclease [Leifsonia poae]|uniref:TM0106 family RecB-like putative nuclease n=1 Tax=Leifsonia poae TaxID=110933 RepID=UPI003D6783EB
MRVTQRTHLIEAGIVTIDDLAHSTGPVDGVADSTVASLREQARLQLDAVAGSPPPVTVYNAPALAVLPHPEAGDIFFDFEGDPLYTEGPGVRWGLDYLFGLVDTDAEFTAFWAHDFAAERVALEAFLAFVRERRREHPGMHIYHYASYERTHLLNIAARHGVGEEDVDQLLRDNVLVDLYPVVRKALRVGSRSYSIKKLEPLYMGDELRESDVTNAADSITEYANARDLLALGQEAEAQRMLDAIGDYNRYDCVSTLRLRDWLLARAAESGIPIGEFVPQSEIVEVEPSTLRNDLLALAGIRSRPSGVRTRRLRPSLLRRSTITAASRRASGKGISRGSCSRSRSGRRPATSWSSRAPASCATGTAKDCRRPIDASSSCAEGWPPAAPSGPAIRRDRTCCTNILDRSRRGLPNQERGQRGRSGCLMCWTTERF